MPAIELEDLIRQLSFSPSQQTKKRTDTADTVGSSSYDSFDAHYEHTTNPVGLEFKDSEYLSRCSSETSLIGKYFNHNIESTATAALAKGQGIPSCVASLRKQTPASPDVSLVT
eukprot:scaffold686_cov245-Skeletonema_marinoi.AAC.10